MPATLCTCVRDDDLRLEVVDPECPYHRNHRPKEQPCT